MLFRQLAEYGDHDPNAVAEWTYYQCRMMVAKEEQLTGKRRVSGEAFRKMRADRKAGIGGPRPKKFLRAFRRG